MKRIFKFCMVAGGLLWASSVTAQTHNLQKSPKRLEMSQDLPLTPAPTLPNKDELQVIPPNTPITGVKIVDPASQIMVMAPPPEIYVEGVTCFQISITSLAFQFHCVHIELLPDEYYSTQHSTWIIRRDGSQPSWALKAEDFDRVKEMATKDSYGYRKNGNQYTGEYYERLFMSAKDQNPPGKYCTLNPMRSAADSNRGCHELMSVWYTAQKGD